MGHFLSLSPGESDFQPIGSLENFQILSKNPNSRNFL